MSEGRIYKAIKSDPGLLITLIVTIGGIVLQYSTVVNKIDNLSDSFSDFVQDSKDAKKVQAEKDQFQDTGIVQNSVDIGNIKGSLSQRGIYVRQVNVRQADTTDESSLQ
jgi:hypothetical protein